MVYYQKTPARVVLELVEKSQLTNEDVFFDLGAGLGQTAILVHLLTGLAAHGVEFEPAFCAYAENCARSLHLSDVNFIHADARHADYSEGTIFFMFTPFMGEILQDVLDILIKQSEKRKIKIINFGPCTAQIALQSWLHFENPNDNVSCRFLAVSEFLFNYRSSRKSIWPPRQSQPGDERASLYIYRENQ